VLQWDWTSCLVFLTIDFAGPCETERAKNVRGTNICKNVLRLRPGEKLKVTFYQNRVVGQNHTSFTRHLGFLVRDRNMCPLRVHSWMDIEEHKLEHMWAAVTVRITTYLSLLFTNNCQESLFKMYWMFQFETWDSWFHIPSPLITKYSYSVSMDR